MKKRKPMERPGYPRLPWNDRERALLKRYYATADWNQLLKVFKGRTRTGIRLYAELTLGIRRTVFVKRPYSPKEEATLRRMFYVATREELFRALPGRTWVSIARHAREILGISRRHLHTPWSAEELAMLKKFCASESLDQLAVRFPNRTRTAIRLQALSLGLRRLPAGRPEAAEIPETPAAPEMWAP